MWGCRVAADMKQALTSAVLRVLRPLVRILLRNGVPYGVFAELARKTYVDVATREFTLPGRKQSVSRVSILTGLSRKEVRRTSLLADTTDAAAVERYHRAARVVTGWVRDRRFSNGSGRPAVLPLEGHGATFAELVKRFSGDVPPRAVLDELLRVGVAERVRPDRIRLLARAYVPLAGESEKLVILGTDVPDLIATIDHNLRAKPGEAFFQRKVAYDNLPAEALPKLRAMGRAKAQALLERLDRWVSRHDRDANPSVRGSGQYRAGIGIHYFEEELAEGLE